MVYVTRESILEVVSWCRGDVDCDQGSPEVPEDCQKEMVIPDVPSVKMVLPSSIEIHGMRDEF
jgi:hypothetical protein